MDSAGTRYYVVVFVLLVSVLEQTASLTCRECYYATDLSKCGATTQCPDGERCGIHEFSSLNGGSQYHAGCLTSEVCSGNRAAPIQIFGRRRRRQASTVRIQCCDTDLCNGGPDNSGQATTSGNNFTTPLPSSGAIATTVSSANCTEHPECKYLIANYQICNDIHAAENICPQSCGVCGGIATSSNEIAVCKDMYPDCQSLIEHFLACSDVEFSLEKCKKSCKMCNGPPLTTPNPNIETPDPNVETPGPNVETPMPNIETPNPNIETPMPSLGTTQQNVETPMPNKETPMPNIETPMPNIETPQPNIETPMPSSGTTQPAVKSTIQNTKTSMPNRETPKTEPPRTNIEIVG